MMKTLILTLLTLTVVMLGPGMAMDKADGMHEKTDGMQMKSEDMHDKGDGMKMKSDDMQMKGDGMKMESDKKM